MSASSRIHWIEHANFISIKHVTRTANGATNFLSRKAMSYSNSVEWLNGDIPL